MPKTPKKSKRSLVPPIKPWRRNPTDFIPTEIAEESVGLILFDIASQQCEIVKDADVLCDWHVRGNETFIVDEDGEELASRDPRVAALVRAGILLREGRLEE
jgi:hypothetical protein